MSKELAPTVTRLLDIDNALLDRAERYRKTAIWQEPIQFDLADDRDVEGLTVRVENGEIESVVDEVDLIANDLFELNNPDKKDDIELRERYVKSIIEQGSSFGKWFLFPWSGKLVRYPSVEDHRALRTSRNRNLITQEEQEKLYKSTIAIFGLSVGSNVVDKLVASGIGGKIIIADMDIIEPSNLNRISGAFSDVGHKKVDLMAKKVSEIDPYLEQVHLPDGVNEDNLDILKREHRPDILIDEIDDLRIKAVIRKFAQEQGIPVLMATDVGDKSLIDIERYDFGKKAPFNNRIKKADFNSLIDGNISEQERNKFLLKIIGIRNVTPRLISSVLLIDKELSGLPQLGVTASIGGSLIATATREIILERKLDSGRYICSPKNILNLAPQTTKKEAIKTILRLLKSMRNQSEPRVAEVQIDENQMDQVQQEMIGGRVDIFYY